MIYDFFYQGEIKKDALSLRLRLDTGLTKSVRIFRSEVVYSFILKITIIIIITAENESFEFFL